MVATVGIPKARPTQAMSPGASAWKWIRSKRPRQAAWSVLAPTCERVPSARPDNAGVRTRRMPRYVPRRDVRVSGRQYTVTA